MTRWDEQPGNHAIQLLNKHGVSPCWPTVHECQEETDAKKILTASPVENWRRPPGRPNTNWMKTFRTWNPITSPRMKQLTWLRIHSGDWCLCLALRTPSRACHNRRWSIPNTTDQICNNHRAWYYKRLRRRERKHSANHSPLLKSIAKRYPSRFVALWPPAKHYGSKSPETAKTGFRLSGKNVVNRQASRCYDGEYRGRGWKWAGRGRVMSAAWRPGLRWAGGGAKAGEQTSGRVGGPMSCIRERCSALCIISGLSWYRGFLHNITNNISVDFRTTAHS